ncbi:MAG: hypothetical protein ACHQ1D_00605 [Nitrososphaerales archaeon]
MNREPDLVVVGGNSQPYLKRWYIIPKNNYFNIYYHEFCANDEDRALHDHPWYSLSFILTGGYYELTYGPDKTFQRKWYKPGSLVFRWPKYTHRIELGKKDNELILAKTLFITGPVLRNWGFYCPKGWVSWKEFGPRRGAGEPGKGCE